MTDIFKPEINNHYFEKFLEDILNYTNDLIDSKTKIFFASDNNHSMICYPKEEVAGSHAVALELFNRNSNDFSIVKEKLYYHLLIAEKEKIGVLLVETTEENKLNQINIIAKWLGPLIKNVALNAKEKERLSSILFSSLSHDVKTPLTAIIGSCSALKQLYHSLTDSARITLINCALEETQRLHDTINNMIILTQLEAYEANLKKEEVDPQIIINQIINKFKSTGLNHNFNLYTDNYKHLIVDKKLIETVIYNILNNAITYSHSSTSINIYSNVIDNNWFLSIKDEGLGIEEKYRDKVFEKFFRINNEGSKIPGVGLGLTVCKEIVLAHKGNINITENTNNTGISVNIEIPLTP
jgi:K+-sensing histidine kinase KdpD